MIIHYLNAEIKLFFKNVYSKLKSHDYNAPAVFEYRTENNRRIKKPYSQRKMKKSKEILPYLLTNRKSWSIITRKVESTTFVSLKCGFAKHVGLTGLQGCEITIERYQ